MKRTFEGSRPHIKASHQASIIIGRMNKDNNKPKPTQANIRSTHPASTTTEKKNKMRRISGDSGPKIQLLTTQAKIRKTVVRIASKITNTLLRNLLFTREIRLVKVLLIERALKITPNLRRRTLEDSNKTKFWPVFKVRMAPLFFKRK